MTLPDPSKMEQLLAALRRLGIQLEACGNRLRFRPREAVTTELLDRIRMHKTELLADLELRQRIAGQLAALVPWTTDDGRNVLVHPLHRRRLEEAGLL